MHLSRIFFIIERMVMKKRRTNLECYEIGLRYRELKKQDDEARIYAQRLKTEWIKEARKSYNPGERQTCFVCDGYKIIAEAHHILELSKQYDLGFKKPNHTSVWLCPNHHRLAHIILSDNFKPEQLDGYNYSYDESNDFLYLLKIRNSIINANINK